MTSKGCRRCFVAFSPARPNQQYCSPECSSAVRSEREKIYQKNRISRALKENAPIQFASSPKISRARQMVSKNIENSIQEACNQIELGKVTTIDISKDLPETLSNWEHFESAYYSKVGTVVKFVKIDGRCWSILKETEREKWTVGKWAQWLHSTRNKEPKIEAFYLVDIPVQDIHTRKLRENPIIDAFSYNGKFCLTQYIKKYSEDIPTPDLKYKASIAPPWGNVMTFPHKSGYGTQLSVHCCIIGSGYNLVHYWPKLNSIQDMIFRQVTKMPPIGIKQNVPHDIDFSVDDNDTVWDTELERLLIDGGVSSNSIRVAPGQAIILPPDQYHCFKKIVQAQDRPDGIPLVGLTCDSTYVGATEESFSSYYQSIKAIQRAHHWPKKAFCRLELALYCLFQVLISLPSMMSDAIFSAHVRGAFPRFVSWVQSQIKDAKLLMELIKCKEDDIVTMEDNEEMLCHQCKFPLVNIFVSARSTDDESKLCTSCVFNSWKSENQKKKSSNANTTTKYLLNCRFASPTALDHLLTHAKIFVGEEGPSSTEEITHEFVSGILMRDEDGTGHPVEASVGEIFPSEDFESHEDIQFIDDSDQQIINLLTKESNIETQSSNQKSNTIPESAKVTVPVRKPLKIHTVCKTANQKQDTIHEEPQNNLSLFGVPINNNKRKKSSKEESDSEPAKKKIKIDATPPPSDLSSRLSDQTINEYLDLRKTSFCSAYIFSTFYYEKFDCGRSEEWSLPYLFDYQRLVIPIFHRHGEHWRLAILTTPQELLTNANKLSSSPSGLFVFDSYYDTTLIAEEIKQIVLRILWMHFTKFNPNNTNLSELADKNLIVYPMKTFRQSNNIDCGVFMLHYIDEFARFKGTDKEQYSRVVWKIPLNVAEKRKEILKTLKESKEFPKDLKSGSNEEINTNDDDSLFNENNPRFKFNIYLPDKEDMTSLRTPNGLISAPILDRYLSFVLDYDKSQYLIIPAHYSAMIENSDEDIIADFPSLITSKFILLPVHHKEHWVLLIVTNVSSVLHSERTNELNCNVFLLDSYHEYQLETDFFFNLANKLLKTAVKIHAKKDDSFNAECIISSSLPVVQQKNGYDCGLFLLHNVETFVKCPFLSAKQFSSNHLWKKSFKPNMRRKQLFAKIASTLDEKYD